MYHLPPVPAATPPDRFRILLVGGGGREHALAWKLAQSPRCEALFTTHPENPGIASHATGVGYPFDLKDQPRLARWCDSNGIDLVVIGPEGPLAAGLADSLSKVGYSAAVKDRAVLGPGASGARLEASKAFAKQVMRSALIPTAEGRTFTSAEDAKAFLSSRQSAYVVKASGLAAGKGVIVPDSLDEALEAIDRIMIRREFGDAGAEVVVEERLQGREASLFALIDGRTIAMLETAQDHKRLGEGDTGPNTGGMGVVSPSPFLDDATIAGVEREILLPLVDTLQREEIPFRGLLYLGLMLTHAGPKVLEFNTRFGDPECQALMVRLRSDLAELLWRTATGALDGASLEWDPRPACCIVLAAKGYPGESEKGQPIEGIDAAEALGDVRIFHASTRMDRGGLVTGGGRVLSVVALGDTPDAARRKALDAADAIRFEGKVVRRDIGAFVPAPARG